MFPYSAPAPPVALLAGPVARDAAFYLLLMERLRLSVCGIQRAVFILAVLCPKPQNGRAVEEALALDRFFLQRAASSSSGWKTLGMAYSASSLTTAERSRVGNFPSA